jgi:hypothetical protein
VSAWDDAFRSGIANEPGREKHALSILQNLAIMNATISASWTAVFTADGSGIWTGYAFIAMNFTSTLQNFTITADCMGTEIHGFTSGRGSLGRVSHLRL